MDSVVVRVTGEAFSVGTIKGNRAWTTINYKKKAVTKTKSRSKPRVQVRHHAEGVTKDEAVVDNLKLFPVVEAWFNQHAYLMLLPLWKDRTPKKMEDALEAIGKRAICAPQPSPFQMQEQCGDGVWRPCTRIMIDQLRRNMEQIAAVDHDDDEVPESKNKRSGQPSNRKAQSSPDHQSDDDDGDDDEEPDAPTSLKREWDELIEISDDDEDVKLEYEEEDEGGSLT